MNQSKFDVEKLPIKLSVCVCKPIFVYLNNVSEEVIATEFLYIF